MNLRRFLLYAGLLSGMLLTYQGVHAAFELPDLSKAINEALQQAQVCQPNTRVVNLCDNRLWGFRTCNAQGTDWIAEQSCQYRTQAEAQAALAPARICSAGQKRACQCDNRLYGNQTCNAQGTDWSYCETACQYRSLAEATTNLNAGAQICKPNSSRACQCGNQKWGYQTCNAQGTLYGKCNNACNYSFPSQVVLPKPPMLNPETIKTLLDLFAQQKAAGNVCSPNTKRACACPSLVPGRAGLPGQQTCKVDGSGWGTCGSCGTVGMPGGIAPPAVTPPPPSPALPIIDPFVLIRIINQVEPNLDPTLIQGMLGIFGNQEPTPPPVREPVINQAIIDSFKNLQGRAAVNDDTLKRFLENRELAPTEPEGGNQPLTDLLTPEVIEAILNFRIQGQAQQPELDPEVIAALINLAVPEEAEEGPPRLDQAAIDAILKAFNARPDKESINRLLGALEAQEEDRSPVAPAPSQQLSPDNAALMAETVANLLAELGRQSNAQGGAQTQGSSENQVLLAGVIEDLLAAYGQQQLNQEAAASGNAGAQVNPPSPIEQINLDRLEQAARSLNTAASKPNADSSTIKTAQQLQKLVDILRAGQQQEKESTSAFSSSTKSYTTLLIGGVILLLAIIAGFVVWVMRTT